MGAKPEACAREAWFVVVGTDTSAEAPAGAPVTVHRLDPMAVSAVVGRLTRATALPAAIVRGRVHVEANHVYVVKPDARVHIEDGVLRVGHPVGGRPSCDEGPPSTTGELYTATIDPTERSAETRQLYEDLTNVLACVAIPLVMVGRDARIRWSTPSAGKVFGIAGTDIGRLIAEVRSISGMLPSIGQVIREVLGGLRLAEFEGQDVDGRWYQLSLRPHLTLDGRIDGAVLSAVDADEVKRGAVPLAEPRTCGETGADTVDSRRGARHKKPLTPREREVLQLLAEGKASKEIAAILTIALPTVETHRHQLMAKSGLRTIAELTKLAIREGLTSADR